MKRKIYNYATLTSLVLLCACLWVWNHSSRGADSLTLHGVGGASMQLTGSGGQVMFTKASSGGGSGGGLKWSSNHSGGDGKLLATSFSFNSDGRNGMTLVAPTWALALVLGILPSLWIYSKVHKKGGKKKKPEGAH